MSSAWWIAGCAYGASSVLLGAFGAHGLKNRVSDPAKLASWSTAAHYQMIHSAVLLLAAHPSLAVQSGLGAGGGSRANGVAKALLTAGMTMFSGSIYLLVLDGERFKPLGPVTPVGGLCLIGGWVALAFSRGRVRL